MTRYFMTIPEAANLIIHAACMTKGDDIYLLHMGEVVHIAELAERMIRMRGLRPHVDIKIVSMGIRPGEKLHEELHTSAETPVETVHPGIVQLKRCVSAFDRNIFWQQLESLTNPGHASNLCLQDFLHVINTSDGSSSNGTVDLPHKQATDMLIQ